LSPGAAVTCGCLNSFAKVSEPALDAWSRILAAVPGARLVLHAHIGSHGDRVARRFEAAGVSGSRIEWVSKLPVRDYFATYARLDVALDPFPYGGGTTTCDALWMGVPVVTMRGRTAVGRAGVSILSNVGLPELIADDVERYVDVAVALAGDRARLSELRRTLRDRMLASPLMDAAGYARGVEAAFRQAWRDWCRTGPGDRS
jgi:predicted O-linked N-acetylglucosamine transferase (SPINDLY family)